MGSLKMLAFLGKANEDRALVTTGRALGSGIQLKITIKYLGVAQFGRALGSGPRGRRFKSSHSDHKNQGILTIPWFLLYACKVKPAVDRSRTRDQGGTSKKRFGEGFFVPRLVSMSKNGAIVLLIGQIMCYNQHKER